MPQTVYRDRRAFQIENDSVRVTVLVEGGHIAEILHKKSGVNPLWTPPWPSIEPSVFNPGRHTEYGNNAESRLLAGIMGHNLCLDVFGGPSAEEAAAGMTVHGESSVAPYAITTKDGELTAFARLPASQLQFERRMQLRDDGVVEITELVDNVSSWDRPVAWTQHVTLGPPFLELGRTEFRMPATRSRVFESDFGAGHGYQAIGADFEWPHVPAKDGSKVDLQVLPGFDVSAGFTAHLMNPAREQAFFLAWSPRHQVLLGYVWRRADFPWLGIWEENHARTHAPWNGQTLTRGMEFGVSPMPETRRQMIERGVLFGERCYRWIPAKSRAEVRYRAFVRAAASIPDAP